jgi:hypothetical protein
MIFEHPQDQNSHFACFKTNASHSLGMKIKKSLLASAIAVCVLASSSGAIQASNETYSYPITSADPVTTTTFPRTTAAKTFAWSSQTVIVGTKLKLSKIVSVKVKGKSNYRVSGVCSLRKGVLSFNRTGKCRVSVSVTAKGTKKIMRSSKLFTVKAEQFSVPQMKLTGTPEEQLNQVVAATAKLAAISDLKGFSSREWNDGYGRLNDSLVSYGIRVRWDPNDEGLDIYQITMGGQSACFVSEYVDYTSMNKYLKPHTCSPLDTY